MTPQPPLPLDISCSLVQKAADAVFISVEATNNSEQTLHMIASVSSNKKQPYVMMNEGALEVIFGINEPDPDIDYFGVEIPFTRPLGPGEVYKEEVQIIPLTQREHFGYDQEVTPLRGDVRVVCRFAVLRAPIEASQRHTLSLQQVLDQHEWAKPIELTVTVP